MKNLHVLLVDKVQHYGKQSGHMAKGSSSPVCIPRELEADAKAKIKVEVKFQNKTFLFESCKKQYCSKIRMHVLK